MRLSLFTLAAAVLLQFSATAQTNTTSLSNGPAETPAVVHINAAIIPVPRTGSITNRQSLVLQRAKDNPGDYDIEFIGDSITQGWEGAGKNVWQEFYGKRKVINISARPCGATKQRCCRPRMTNVATATLFVA